MNNLFNILFSAVRAKIMPLWIKLRLIFSPSFIKTRVLVKVREFFVKILDVKPRHKRDYYQIFNWLISKRLAFAVVVVIGLVAAFVITTSLPEGFFGGVAEASETYKYRSVPLRFHSGNVKILARDGYVAYEGEVSEGAANGKGTLFAADGSMVYSGQFANNMYNGNGTFYYPSGNPKYVGSFTDNLFDGTGAFYRDNGTMEYNGEFDNGERNGKGTLYDSVGNPIYQGNFLLGEITFPDFLSRPTSDVASLYSGETEIYECGEEYCVVMSDISAIYSVKDGSDTLESEWTVETVYVMDNDVTINGKKYSNIRDIKELFGEPMYFGSTWIELPEAVAWKNIYESSPDIISKVNVNATEGLKNVFAVSDYNRDFQIYIYTFEKDGLLYTFYFNGAGETEFLMYAIEKA